MFYAERFPNPTRASSPRQLPTDHVHAVPTREYQSDPSSRMLLRGHRLCCPKQNLLKAHQRERVPATPPVDSPAMPERRAAVKGAPLFGAAKRTLDCCAPFWPDRYRDGRLRQEHFTARCTRQKQIKKTSGSYAP